MEIVERRHLVVIAAGYASGLAAFPWLPGPYLGSGQTFVSRAAIAFLIPTSALVTCSAIDTLFRRTNSDEPHVESAKAVRAVVSFTALFMTALHGVSLLGMLGLTISGFSPNLLIVVLFGLFLVTIVLVRPVRVPRLTGEAFEGPRQARQLEGARVRDHEIAREGGRAHARTSVSAVLPAILVGTDRMNALVFAGVAAVLLATGVAASPVPARRAMRVDPMTTLRAE